MFNLICIVANFLANMPKAKATYLEGLLWFTHTSESEAMDFDMFDWIDALKAIPREIKWNDYPIETVGQDDTEPMYLPGDVKDIEILGYWIYLNGPKELVEELRKTAWSSIVCDPKPDDCEWDDIGPQDEPVDYAYAELDRRDRVALHQDSFWD